MGEAEPGRGSSHGLIDNFYLSHQQIANESPSRLAGVSEDAEIALRCFGCDRVQRAVLYLRMPQAVAATGQVLLHRFYCKESLTVYDVKRVAMAATWLAIKLEETPRSSKDLLRVFARIDSRVRAATGEKLKVIDVHSSVCEGVKQDVFNIEKTMLRVLGFVTHVEHPHKFVLSLITILGVTQLQQEAWNLTNDSLRTTLCVRFKCEVVACGIIFLAARRMQMPMPEKPGEEWWQLCSVKREDVLEVAFQIQMLYRRPPAAYTDVKAALAVSTAAAPAAAAAIATNAAGASLTSSPAVVDASPAVVLMSPSVPATVQPATVQNGGGSGSNFSSTLGPSPISSAAVDQEARIRHEDSSRGRGSPTREERQDEQSPGRRPDTAHDERRRERHSRNERVPSRHDSTDRRTTHSVAQRDESKRRRDPDSRPSSNGAMPAREDRGPSKRPSSRNSPSPVLPEASTLDERKRPAPVPGGPSGGKLSLKRSRLSPPEELPRPSEVRRKGDNGREPDDARAQGDKRAPPQLNRPSDHRSDRTTSDSVQQSPSSPPTSLPARHMPSKQHLNRLAGQALSSIGLSSKSREHPTDSHTAVPISHVSATIPITLPDLHEGQALPPQQTKRHTQPPSSSLSHTAGPPRMKSAAERHLSPLPPLKRGPTRLGVKSALVSLSPTHNSSDFPG